MTGPEHYAEAERLADIVSQWAQENEADFRDPRRNSAMIAPAYIECAKTLAQVHATLAMLAVVLSAPDETS